MESHTWFSRVITPTAHPLCAIAEGPAHARRVDTDATPPCSNFFRNLDCRSSILRCRDKSQCRRKIPPATDGAVHLPADATQPCSECRGNNRPSKRLTEHYPWWRYGITWFSGDHAHLSPPSARYQRDLRMQGELRCHPTLF
jgi:hypothetical protein